MPNPKRAITGGHRLFHSIVDYFSDDMTHRNLPHEILQQEFHVHFVSTSPNASTTEQFKEFKTLVERTHTDPVRVEEEDKSTTCLCIYVNSGASDNPMQSEISSHIGGKGNHFCRKCQVSGTQKEKATNDGYHALFEPGLPRTKEYILDELGKQVKLACSGVAQPIKDTQTDTGVKDMYTQYWIEKLISRFREMKKDNIWHISHTTWSEEEKKTYALCLQSTATNGLSIHAIIMQYAGSLMGRQFKTIVQTNIFHVYGLVTDNQFIAWKATGELSALLWFPEIRNMTESRTPDSIFNIQQDLKIAVANVLDIFAVIDPSKVMTEIKLHLLVHIDDDAVEIGPLLGAITEIFECFNAVFRFCSILSNHLAPSRDIAVQLSRQEGLKHCLIGGRWPHGTERIWRTAGPGVRQFMEKHPVLQKLLGWTENKLLVHGEAKLPPLPWGHKARAEHTLGATNAARALNFGIYPSESIWQKCRQVVSESLDQCFVGSWTRTIPGRISEILQGNGSLVLVVLEHFQVLSTRDEVYGMPVTFSIIPAKNVKFNFNVQHDCYSAKCEARGVRMQMQEWVESDKTENFIVHNPLDRYIINSHAFHNTHLIRATLPRSLLAPIPLFENWKEKHDELATTLPRRAATASKKRKADQDDGDTETRPRKRRKKVVGKQKEKTGPAVAGMVANRSQ
ncbi:hypothetical protein DFH07DRAFT_865468 [Mycena maculata]|uniref:Uncharacterized protein n=1 Tax=Mycena maculata TaxID=230809 RepID=A0AAD7K5G5_9AGAR|nr:hypothetical protein DFH07DRAFT_865468 [Mycena maculata]